MQPARLLRAAHAHTPLIKFLGKRTFPQHSSDEAPRPHPQSPTGELPATFKTHSQKGEMNDSSSQTPAESNPAKEKRVEQLSSRSKLPPQYHYAVLTQQEMDAIDSGGATAYRG